MKTLTSLRNSCFDSETSYESLTTTSFSGKSGTLTANISNIQSGYYFIIIKLNISFDGSIYTKNDNFRFAFSYRTSSSSLTAIHYQYGGNFYPSYGATYPLEDVDLYETCSLYLPYPQDMGDISIDFISSQNVKAMTCQLSFYRVF